MSSVRHNSSSESREPEGDNVVVIERRQTAEAPSSQRAEAPMPQKGAPAAEEAAKPSSSAPKRRSRRKLLLGTLLLVALLAGGYYGYDWWTYGRFIVSTDDAYVQADLSALGTKVSGYVAAVLVKDGDQVHAGQTLVQIDDTDYRLALQSAKEKRATQAATISRITQQIAAQSAQIESAKANLASARAEATRAEADFKRASTLTRQNFASKASLDQATADRDRAEAAVQSGEAALAAAQANLDVIKAQKLEAEQTARELDTAIAKAESDLEATTIRAPVDGVIGNRAVEVGQYISPGSRLMALVPLQSAYIEANFKETQLQRLHPGQRVEIELDALSDRTFEGRIVSLSPASGAMFSLLPPENATGNFTKIVQRLPVRIEVPTSAASEGVLRPGLSVIVSVDTRDEAQH